MPNRNLLVPGTGGITLMGSDGQDTGYPVKMRLGVLSKGLLGKSADELIEQLSMEHIPGKLAPARTSLQQGYALRPGHVLKVAYNQVPDQYNHFLYDWRADMRHSATQLLEYLQQRKPEDGRWNIVGHSQGGLLIILASKLLPNREDFAELAASVVLVGAPVAGTVNACRGLIVGDDMGKAGSEAFQTIIRTWPSIHQMMPAWPAIVDKSGESLPEEQQLLNPIAWGNYDNISEDLLKRAREAQLLLRDPIGWMDLENMSVAILMARNRPTRIHILKTDKELDCDKQKKQLGDTLVPHDQTLRWTGGPVGRLVRTYLSPCNEHAFLLNDPAILGEVRNVAK